MARFVAEAALAAANAAPPAPVRRSPSRLALAEIADAVAAINRIGNNLNQLAREKNTTDEVPAQTEVVIQRVQAALDRLTKIVDDVHRDLS